MYLVEEQSDITILQLRTFLKRAQRLISQLVKSSRLAESWHFYSDFDHFCFQYILKSLLCYSVDLASQNHSEGYVRRQIVPLNIIKCIMDVN